ncbi:MAG: ATP-binding protein [Bacteroidales bacterium]|nr:ATP-binding protein [Bacteroidales bacterium]
MEKILETMCEVAQKLRRDPEKNELVIDEKHLQSVEPELQELRQRLGLNTMQVLILMALVHHSYRNRTDGDDIARFLGMDYMKFLTYDEELETLRKKGYIRKNNKEDYYSIPSEVLRDLRENRAVTPQPLTGLSTAQILGWMKNVLGLLREGNLTSDEAFEEIKAVLKSNPETGISRTCEYYLIGISWDEAMVFFIMIYYYWYRNDDMLGWHDFVDYFEDDDLDEELQVAYATESLELQERGIIEYAGNGGMMTKDYFHIKDEIKEKLFAEVGGLKNKETEKKVSSSQKVEASSIGVKSLFYNEPEGMQVAQLKELLMPENFENIRSRMKEKGLRSAFTCLLYGGPGTGKTETVYQLARESGRDLFIVDVSQIKNCWVGESEKNIKAVFNKYRECVSGGGTAPVLLFNEADAIFGIRQQGAERAVDKMENSIQNIILQEMEDLDGILIATTNLTENLDKAFERRFLYKIRFNNPSAEVKRKIWKAMMPDLCDGDAALLSDRFELSGGQIENVARKKMIQSILSGKEPTVDELARFCSEECIASNSAPNKIGF